MTANNEHKLKILLDGHRYGAINLARYLEQKGISRDLQQYYCKSGWLESVGRGAFKRPNEDITWQNALQTLINQSNFYIHVGGLTALSQQGAAHYLRLGKEKIYLFSPPGRLLPAWFKNHHWGAEIIHIKTGFISGQVSLNPDNEFSGQMLSTPELAILECLFLAPKKQDLLECYQLMEGLVNLRPKLMQQLLEACTSIKVKRLFLYLAEKANHQWLQYIDLSKVTLGKGDRSLVDKGVYVGKYRISVPAELAAL